MSAPHPATAGFHVMAKPTGALCNLDCSYCFFLTKEQLYPGAAPVMTPAVQEAYVRQLLESQRELAEVTIAFQGGEPTMAGLDFYRRAVDLAATYAAPGQRVVFAIQTNATLLDDEWGAFLAAHDFLVGVSIDGPRELHDAYRVDKGGKPTFDRVMAGLEVLLRHGVEWNALTTVHAANAAHGLAVYRFLRDVCGARHLQFIPIVERAGADTLPLLELGRELPLRDRPLYTQTGSLTSSRSVSGEAYGQFLVEVFEEWVRHDVASVFVQDFDSALARQVGRGELGMCIHAEDCGRQVALEPNGDVYSCDHFVEPDHLLGNLTLTPLADSVFSAKQLAFGSAKSATLPEACRACPFLDACNGGCPKDRFVPAPSGPPENHLCAGYLRFFGHVADPMRRMAELLGEQQPVTVLMAQAAAADARRGRNDPCPCGSTRKWKRCHGGR